ARAEDFIIGVGGDDERALGEVREGEQHGRSMLPGRAESRNRGGILPAMTASFPTGHLPCDCHYDPAPSKRIVITGGPGAGKTAVLEAARHALCGHAALLPEAASLVFGGGFPRTDGIPSRWAAQRTIFRVQSELERLAIEEARYAVILCDRGTLDSLAYLPGDPEPFLSDLGTSHAAEMAHYAAVIHLDTPEVAGRYNHQNPLRIETPAEAMAINARIAEIWSGHPNRVVISQNENFLAKIIKAITAIHRELPECCRKSVQTQAPD
ncbi:MAG: ATP-binding protein, partial [bacterium]